MHFFFFGVEEFRVLEKCRVSFCAKEERTCCHLIITSLI